MLGQTSAVVTLSLFALALSGAEGLFAQELQTLPAEPEQANEDPGTDTQASNPVPLTVKQKYLWSVNKVFNRGHLLGIAARAALEPMGKKAPNEWGVGADSYAVRTGSYLGRSILRQNLAFGVRAFDHEDPRYFPSGEKGVWQRTKYAIFHTFLVRNDYGAAMPAYSLFVTDYSMPFIEQQWRTNHFRTMQGFRHGTASLGAAVGLNVCQEFWPDMKSLIKKIRR